MVQKSLSSWSWQDIQSAYGAFGKMLTDYKNVADRFELHLPMESKPGQVYPYYPGSESFVRSWYDGVNNINEQLKALDKEIERRSQLIGVMG